MIELQFLHPTLLASTQAARRLLALYSNICAILHAAACWPEALITDLQHGTTNKAVQADQVDRPRSSTCAGMSKSGGPDLGLQGDLPQTLDPQRNRRPASKENCFKEGICGSKSGMRTCTQQVLVRSRMGTKASDKFNTDPIQHLGF